MLLPYRTKTLLSLKDRRMLAFARHSSCLHNDERANLRLEPSTQGTAAEADPTMAAVSTTEPSGRISKCESYTKYNMNIFFAIPLCTLSHEEAKSIVVVYSDPCRQSARGYHLARCARLDDVYCVAASNPHASDAFCAPKGPPHLIQSSFTVPRTRRRRLGRQPPHEPSASKGRHHRARPRNAATKSRGDTSRGHLIFARAGIARYGAISVSVSSCANNMLRTYIDMCIIDRQTGVRGHHSRLVSYSQSTHTLIYMNVCIHRCGCSSSASGIV